MDDPAPSKGGTREGNATYHRDLIVLIKSCGAAHETWRAAVYTLLAACGFGGERDSSPGSQDAWPVSSAMLLHSMQWLCRCVGHPQGRPALAPD